MKLDFWTWLESDGTVSLEEMAAEGRCVVALHETGNVFCWCVRSMQEAQ